MGFSRQEYWSGLPFPSPVGHILSDLSTMTRPSWVAPQAWLGFIELDKAVVLVWLDWLFFCEYGFSVSALWCPLATPTILLGFLLAWAWGISSRLLQQSTATAPYLGGGVFSYHLHSWPSTWDSSSRPSCACSATAPRVAPLSRWPWPQAWVAPPSCCPWPRAQGGSSGSPPLASGARWLLPAAPDLRHGVVPLAISAPSQPGTLGHCPWLRTWGSSPQPPPALRIGLGRL